ncbi:MAG: CDP-alcohol phosphatidyltransferase family protein [Ruminococcaceae bacterium]|nr:CDP-alcohol phosphatidyltransferase family protein [Oscillospiraceae bacterium]
MNKKDWLSIPNILSVIRILLIPVFAWSYLTAGDDRDYLFAAIVVVISGVTDFLDGMIARKFNMITELGKFLDPLADKMTQGSLFLCLAIRYPHIWLLLVLWALKDGFMAIMGLILLRKKRTKLDGAKWYGKVCTAIIYLGVLLLLFFPNTFAPESYPAHILILVCASALLLAGILYTIELIKLWLHNETIKREKKKKAIKTEN